MRTFGLFLVIAIGLAKAATIAPTTCLSDADCSDTECCYKKHEFLVVSKRGAGTFEGYPVHNQDLTHVHGVCQGYHNEGDPCSPWDKANGYCSCNDKAGMVCQYEAAHGELLASRNVMPFARYTCKKAVN